MYGPEGKQNELVSRGRLYIRCFVIYLYFPLSNRAVVFGARATTAQLYPGRDTFEFDQGQVAKNQPITVLILLSESLAI